MLTFRKGIAGHIKNSSSSVEVQPFPNEMTYMQYLGEVEYPLNMLDAVSVLLFTGNFLVLLFSLAFKGLIWHERTLALELKGPNGHLFPYQ